MESDDRREESEGPNDAGFGSRGESPPTIQPGPVEDKHGSGPDALQVPEGKDTIVPGAGRARPPEEGPGTILVSSSSKARTRIEVCGRCKNDNPPGARYCESCGADLDRQREERSLEESRKRSEKQARMPQRSGAERQGHTILRGPGSSPERRPEADIVEKRSYYSEYLPPGASGENLDHESFRSRAGPPPMRPVQQARQLPRLPVDAGRRPSEEKQTSLVVGIAVAAVLFVVFVGLIATLIVLLLK